MTSHTAIPFGIRSYKATRSSILMRRIAINADFFMAGGPKPPPLFHVVERSNGKAEAVDEVMVDSGGSRRHGFDGGSRCQETHVVERRAAVPHRRNESWRQSTQTSPLLQARSPSCLGGSRATAARNAETRPMVLATLRRNNSDRSCYFLHVRT